MKLPAQLCVRARPVYYVIGSVESDWLTRAGEVEGLGGIASLSAKLIGSHRPGCRSDDNTHTWNKIYNYNHGYIMAKI